jgi:hypothetical protein
MLNSGKPSPIIHSAGVGGAVPVFNIGRTSSPMRTLPRPTPSAAAGKLSGILVQPTMLPSSTVKRQTMSFLQRRRYEEQQQQAERQQQQLVLRMPHTASLADGNGTRIFDKQGARDATAPSAIVAKRILDSLNELASPMEEQRRKPSAIPTREILHRIGSSIATPSSLPSVSYSDAKLSLAGSKSADVHPIASAISDGKKDSLVKVGVAVESNDKEFRFEAPPAMQDLGDNFPGTEDSSDIKFVFSPPAKKSSTNGRPSVTPKRPKSVVKEPKTPAGLGALTPKLPQMPVESEEMRKSSPAPPAVTSVTASSSVVSKDSAWARAIAANNDSVKCPACFVPNSKSAKICVSCESDLPSSEGVKSSASAQSSSGTTSWLTTPSSSAPASVGSGFTFGATVPAVVAPSSHGSTAGSTSSSFGGTASVTPALIVGGIEKSAATSHAPVSAALVPTTGFSFGVPVKAATGFTFGGPTAADSKPVSATQSSAPVVDTGFTFGNSKPSVMPVALTSIAPVPVASSLVFGAPALAKTDQPNSNGGFSVDNLKAPEPASFVVGSLGDKKSSTVAVAAPLSNGAPVFQFGTAGAGNQDNSKKRSSADVSAPPVAAVPSASSTGPVFTFGSSSKPAESAVAVPAPLGGGNQNKAALPSFQFGSGLSQLATGTPSMPSSSSTPPAPVGTTAPGSAPFMFGSTGNTSAVPSTTATTFTFAAGGTSSNVATTTSSVSKPVAPASTPFTFGTGAPPAAAPAPFMFGVAKDSRSATPPPSFQFGSGTGATGANAGARSAVSSPGMTPDSPGSTMDLGYQSGDASNLSIPPSVTSVAPNVKPFDLFGSGAGIAGQSTNAGMGIAFGQNAGVAPAFSFGGPTNNVVAATSTNPFGGPLNKSSSTGNMGSIGTAQSTASPFMFGGATSAVAPPSSGMFGSGFASAGTPAAPFGSMSAQSTGFSGNMGGSAPANPFSSTFTPELAGGGFSAGSSGPPKGRKIVRAKLPARP